MEAALLSVNKLQAGMWHLKCSIGRKMRNLSTMWKCSQQFSYLNWHTFMEVQAQEIELPLRVGEDVSSRKIREYENPDKVGCSWSSGISNMQSSPSQAQISSEVLVFLYLRDQRRHQLSVFICRHSLLHATSPYSWFNAGETLPCT